MADPADNKSPAPAPSAKAAVKLRTFADFLESSPPDTPDHVSGLLTLGLTGSNPVLNTPELMLHCDSETCNGVRSFKAYGDHYIRGKRDFEFVTYGCKNCEETEKTFALIVVPDSHQTSGHVQKL